MRLKGKKVAVLGLGLEGKDLVSFLLRGGANITVFDKKDIKELDLEGIEIDKIKLVTGENYLSGGLSNFDIIFRSPGVYRYLPEIVKAEKSGVEVSSAIKLFFDMCPATTIGVTGTKGKGTTATLTYQILKNSGQDVYLSGNIGNPYLNLSGKLKKTSVVVLEMSSFQLIDMTKSPHVSVVLNITSDHLDWHKDINEYIKAKENIVKFQKKKDYTVINADYEVPRSFSEKTKAQIYFFSKNQLLDRGSFVLNDDIVFVSGGQKSSFGKSYGLLLRGEHNLENVCAAVCVGKIFGIKDEIIKKTIFEFRGLEHRLELAGNVGGVAFYNDSFATGPQPTIAAIKSFVEPLTVILGGSEKFLNYKELGNEISKAKNLRNVVLIGQIAGKIEKAIRMFNFKGKIIRLGKTNMKKIVEESFKDTPKGGVVLLSPAAASFDMFSSYKDRGNQFKKAVLALKNGQ